MQGMRRRQFEQGSINGWMVGTIGFLVLTLIAGAVAAWMFVEYTREKTGVDAKVASAVAKAVRKFAER